MENEQKTEKLEKIWEDATQIYADCLNEIFKSIVKLRKEQLEFKKKYNVNIGLKEIES